MLVALNKPYGFLSQFSPEPVSNWGTLSTFEMPRGIYPVGRLDADSEGLLLLTDEKTLVDRFLNPKQAHEREYWAQVEGTVTETGLEKLRRGVTFGAQKALPCKAERIGQPKLWERVPAIRFRKHIPDSWVQLVLTEGKNRQVRRMTAAIGHPTLRLIRVRIGGLELKALGLAPRFWKELGAEERNLVLRSKV